MKASSMRQNQTVMKTPFIEQTNGKQYRIDPNFFQKVAATPEPCLTIKGQNKAALITQTNINNQHKRGASRLNNEIEPSSVG